MGGEPGAGPAPAGGGPPGCARHRYGFCVRRALPTSPHGSAHRSCATQRRPRYTVQSRSRESRAQLTAFPTENRTPFEQKEPDYLLWGPLRSRFASSSTPAGCLLQLNSMAWVLDAWMRGREARNPAKKNLLALNGFFDNPPSV
jgi:hypothetical protein